MLNDYYIKITDKNKNANNDTSQHGTWSSNSSSTSSIISTFIDSNNNYQRNQQIAGSAGLDYIGYTANQTYFNDLPSVNSTITEPPIDFVEKQYWSLLLIIFPLLTFLGNLLVVSAVCKEKSLRTVTNYFVVSLAIADLLVATAVMPFTVYLEVARHWGMSQTLCDAWVATDVMACTASILNLVAIAIDRFIAVTQPIKYARHKNSKRIFFMLAFVWLVSIAIASPIVAGLNDTPQGSRNPLECTFNNPTFIIYSSMFSFYIPAMAMLFLYYRIFQVIRSRAKKTKKKYGNHANSAKVANKNGANIRSLLKNITTTTITNNKTDDFNVDNKTNETITVLEKQLNGNIIEMNELLPKTNKNSNNNTNAVSLVVETNVNHQQKNQRQKVVTKKKFPNASLSPSANASSKEKKVTKTLAIVIILFLLCWLPFFTINNLLTAICMKMGLTCEHINHVDLLKFFNWLGYTNSFLNPIVYGIFNIEFRKAFVKIISELFKKRSF